MSHALNQHKGRLMDVVDDAIRTTFKLYFDIDVDVEKIRSIGFLKDSVTCRTRITDGDLQGSVYISIEKTMLEQLALKAYPPGTSLDEEKTTSCALEIANIVCARVKTYLNDEGYNFGMDVPSVLPEGEKIDDNLEMIFSVREEKLVVDIGLHDNRNYAVSSDEAVP